MTEIVIGLDLSVTCSDGTTRNNVKYKIKNGIVIYETQDGESLKGATKVIGIDGGNLIGDIRLLAQANFIYNKED